MNKIFLERFENVSCVLNLNVLTLIKYLFSSKEVFARFFLSLYFNHIDFNIFSIISDRNLDQPTLSITGHTTTTTDNNKEYTHTKENGYQYGDVDIKANSFTSKRLNGEQQQLSSAGTCKEKNNKSSGVLSSDLCICKNLYTLKNTKMDNSNNRDRIGQWGTVSDSETPGNLSGLDRMRNGRYNKVRE